MCGDKRAFIQGINEEDTNRRYTSLMIQLSEIMGASLSEDEAMEEEEELSPYDFL
jgi:exodeoxyribonuclease V alpha subunit